MLKQRIYSLWNLKKQLLSVLRQWNLTLSTNYKSLSLTTWKFASCALCFLPIREMVDTIFSNVLLGYFYPFFSSYLCWTFAIEGRHKLLYLDDLPVLHRASALASLVQKWHVKFLYSSSQQLTVFECQVNKISNFFAIKTQNQTKKASPPI